MADGWGSAATDGWGATATTSGWGGGGDAGGGERKKGCFKCGEEGHNKADCPKAGEQKRGCFRCGQEGHNKADCPNPPAEGERKPRLDNFSFSLLYLIISLTLINH